MILTIFPIWKRSPHRGKRHAAAPASGRKSQLGLRDRGFLALLAALSHSCCEYCRLRRSALATLELATAVCIDQLPNERTAIARVANCVPPGARSKYKLVGLALDEPENIWEIHPAPADWGTESAVAVAAITATNASVPTKKCGQENCVGYRNFSK